MSFCVCLLGLARWDSWVLNKIHHFYLFFSAKHLCCNSSLLEDMCAMCCCRYALVSFNCVKANISASEAYENFATPLLRLFYSFIFPVNPCCWDVLDCISFWIIYSLLKRKRNSLKVFWISGILIHYLYANLYFPLASINVSAVFINCSAVNTVTPAIVKRWHSPICLKMSAIGRCEVMGVVGRVVFTSNSSGLMRQYD